MVKSIEAFCQRVQQGLAEATFEQKRQLVELLIDRVVVTEEEVETCYVIPTPSKSEYVRFCHLRLDYLDAPMASDRVSKGLGIACQAHHIVAPFAGDLLAYLPLRFDHAHTAQPRPRLLRIEIGDHFRIGNRSILTPFHSAMSYVLRWVVVKQQVSPLGQYRLNKQDISKGSVFER